MVLRNTSLRDSLKSNQIFTITFSVPHNAVIYFHQFKELTQLPTKLLFQYNVIFQEETCSITSEKVFLTKPSANPFSALK